MEAFRCDLPDLDDLGRAQPGNTAPEIEILYSTREIADRVESLAGEIARSVVDDLLVVAILKGSFMFTADLLRALYGAKLSPQVDFIFLASYGTKTTSSGHVRVLRDIETDVRGRHVLITDDILESGRTLSYAKSLIESRGAACVETCVLLDKTVPRAEAIDADYSGFVCPNDFVIGYGMDLAHRYRELPFIGRIRQDRQT